MNQNLSKLSRTSSLVLLVLFGPYGAISQEDPNLPNNVLSSEAPTLRFEQLSIEDGLSQSSGLNMMQDSKGFLWISTQGGLHRYDGYEFKVFKSIPFDTTSLSESWVWGVTESTNGDLWVSTMDGGLNRLDPASGQARHYRHDTQDSTSISSDRPLFTLETQAGDLWVGTFGQGLNRMRPTEDGLFKRFYHDPKNEESISSNLIFWMSEDQSGNVWVGTANGINRINPETEEIKRYLHDPTANPVYRDPLNVFGQYLIPGDEEYIWLATGDGLVRLEKETGEYDRFQIEQDNSGYNPLNLIHEIRPDPNDANILWVGGPGTGIARFDLRTHEFTSYRNNPKDEYSLSDNDVQSLLLDQTGMMWVGTNGQGLNKFNPGAVNFNHIVHSSEDPESVTPGIVWGIYEDKFGSLWVGTNDGSGQYLTQFDAATRQVRKFQNDPNDSQSLQLGNFWAFAEDQNDQFWVAGLGGLSKFNRKTGKVKRYLFPDFTGVFVLELDANDPNLMWIGTGSGLHSFDLTTEEARPVPLLEDTMKRLSVLDIQSTKDGTLYVGTNTEGFFSVKNGKATQVSKYDPRDTSQINNNSAQVILQRESEPHIIWIGTSNGGGLNRFDTNTRTARHFMQEDGLAGEIIYGMLEDNNGTLWISTNTGISNFNPDTEEFRNYGLDDGLIALEYSQNAFLKGNDGTLYFGSNEGVTAFSPESLKTNSIPPQVVINDFKVANQSVNPGPDQPIKEPILKAKRIELDYDQNEFTLKYAGLHFSNPSRNQYAYQLVGFDDDWVDAGTKRIASYTNLPPGEYTFNVKASNSDGIWNEKGASIDVIVFPPWYRTWWAYVLFVVLFGLGVLAIDRIQRYRLSLKEKEKSALREAKLKAEAENKRRADTEELSKIGRTITSSLSINKIIETVYENVNALMDAAVFGVGIYNDARNRLDFPATKEEGVMLEPYFNNLEEERLASWCFNNQKEVIIADFDEEYGHYLTVHKPVISGKDTNSIIYLPLIQQGRAIGVITTQSFEKHAYTPYHVNLLRNLANYAAIAIDNASAYRKLDSTIDELKSMQEQLIQQEKMASLGELTAGIAHEIQNPLNFVNNFSEVNVELTDELVEEAKNGNLTEVKSLVGEIKSNEEKIVHHGKRAEGIVKSMLQHSRTSTGEKEATDINLLCDEYLRLAYHGLRAKDKSFNAEFKTNLSNDIPKVNVVAQDIGRVLLNLINNAFQAVSANGHTDQSDYQPFVEVSTSVTGNNVEISISDNGPGIPDKIRDKIFEPFFTTKPAGIGTGLGLSMSYEIITKGHGGTLSIDSKQKQGTKFIIQIPKTT